MEGRFSIHDHEFDNSNPSLPAGRPSPAKLRGRSVRDVRPGGAGGSSRARPGLADPDRCQSDPAVVPSGGPGSLIADRADAPSPNRSTRPICTSLDSLVTLGVAITGLSARRRAHRRGRASRIGSDRRRDQALDSTRISDAWFLFEPLATGGVQANGLTKA